MWVLGFTGRPMNKRKDEPADQSSNEGRSDGYLVDIEELVAMQAQNKGGAGDPQTANEPVFRARPRRRVCTHDTSPYGLSNILTQGAGPSSRSFMRAARPRNLSRLTP